MKGYQTTIIALHCAAAVCAIIVIGVAGDSLAAINKATKAVDQFLEGLGLQETSWKGPDTSKLGFIIFVAVTGLLLNVFFVALQLLPRVYDTTLGALASKGTAGWVQRPFFEALLSALWSVMWLAGAAAVSHLLEGAGDCAGLKACDLANTLMAFSWLSWLLWCAGTAMTAWTWGKGVHTATAAAAAGATPGTAAAAAPADAKCVEAGAAADDATTGVPVSGVSLEAEKPGTGVDAV